MDKRSTVLVLSLVGAIIGGMFASNAIKQAQKTREGTKLEQALQQAQEAQEGTKLEQALKQAQEVSKLEQQGFTALRQFEFQELEALLMAMEAGQRLKELVKDGRQLEKYPASSPILALQTILDNIHERTQLTNNQSNFKSASFSPDGTRIVTASYQDRAKVWDTSGNLLAELKDNYLAESASFSPDGTRIVTASYQDRAKVWDTSGNLLAELKGHKDRVESASFSSDGRRIVTASRDGTAKVWDTSGNLLAELKGHKNWVESASFSPDGTRILTASKDGTVKVWDTSGNLLAELKIDKGSKYSISPRASFSPDGQRIVTAGGKAKVWDTSGKLLITLDYAHGASFSPDGKLIITFSYGDDTVRISDSSGVLKAELKGHGGGVRSVSFSSDGQLLLVAPSRRNGTAKVWEISGKQLFDGKLFTNLNRRDISSASFSPNGDRIVTISSSVGQSEYVNIWDLSGRGFGNIKLFEGNKPLKDVVASPNGQHILTSSYKTNDTYETTFSVWNLSGRLLGEFKSQQDDFRPSFSQDGRHILTSAGKWNDKTIKVWNLSGRLVATLKGWRGVFSPDGKHIITTFQDKPTAQVWDLSGRLLTELKGHQDVIRNASFSPDGQHIITVSTDNTARVWDLSGKVLAEIKDFDSKSRSLRDYKLLWSAGLYRPTVTFSPDGQRILTVNDYDNTVRLWDLSGNLLTEKKYQDSITEASFSPDGQRIIGFSSGTAYVLDLSGRQLAELKGHQDSISQASFSPDGQRILTVSSDNTARLWDLSGRLLAELKMLDSQETDFQRLRTAFFSQDGKQIVAVSNNGIIRAWQVGGLDELLVRGCDWLKDYLTTHPEAREKLKVCQQK